MNHGAARALVITKLVAYTELTTKLGSAKIWPSQAEQGALKPYVLVHKPAQENRQLLVGDAGFPRARVSIEIVAGTGTDADVIGGIVYAALKDVTNETIIVDGTSYSVTVVPTDFDTDDASNKRAAFRRIIDFYVDFH